MVSRTRKIVLRVPVTPEERELIEQKMTLLHTDLLMLPVLNRQKHKSTV